MKRMHQLDAAGILSKQKESPVRHYATDRVQAPRIEMVRQAIGTLLKGIQPAAQIQHSRRKIIELGASGGDISGFFSWGHNVVMYEVSPSCTHEIGKSWHWAEVVPEDVNTTAVTPCDILVMCEILEHVADPVALAARWMPEAKYCVLSSPLGGDVEKDYSDGEHVHSFDEKDFESFVREGKHTILTKTDLRMGVYTIRMLVTKRNDSISL